MLVPESNLQLIRAAERGRKATGMATSPARVVTVFTDPVGGGLYHWVDLVNLLGDPRNLPYFRVKIVYGEKVVDATRRLQPFGFIGDELTFFAQKIETTFRWVLVDPRYTDGKSPGVILFDGRPVTSDEYRPYAPGAVMVVGNDRSPRLLC
ncbi:MAG: hypothetical protein NUV59_04415 [Patescibacteria group bacterium]|nr:hypothetical protein [Patescibacteria group bacterium]